ncbi:MAG: AzlC family ABC transporter permease [Reyranellaceae bacterium]
MTSAPPPGDTPPAPPSPSACRRGLIKVSPMLVGTALFGLATGAAVAQAPVQEHVLFAMPLVIYSGAGQLAYAQLVALGAPFLSMLATLVLINLRYLIYATIVGSWPRPRSLLVRIFGPFLISENSFALALDEKLEDRFGVVLGSGLALCVVWVSTCTVGALLSSQLPPLKHAYAIPAIVLAPILVGLIKDRQRLAIAALAFAFGVALAALPYRLGPLFAGVVATILVMASIGLWKRRR